MGLIPFSSLFSLVPSTTPCPSPVGRMSFSNTFRRGRFRETTRPYRTSTRAIRQLTLFGWSGCHRFCPGRLSARALSGNDRADGVLTRQWMDHERVLYRLMQPSLEMIAQVDEKLLPPLYRSPLFWLGLAISFSIGVITALYQIRCPWLHLFSELGNISVYQRPVDCPYIDGESGGWMSRSKGGSGVLSVRRSPPRPDLRAIRGPGAVCVGILKVFDFDSLCIYFRRRSLSPAMSHASFAIRVLI